jgi:hypothetical protein
VRETLTIDPRFNGPPDSGNGGYTCGRLAAFVDAPAAEVTLRLPPPLGRELEVERGDDGSATLLDGENTVAEARPVELDAQAPPAATRDSAARAASESIFIDAEAHPFPTCFVCGPRRAQGDGLRIFAGPIDPPRAYGAPWTPEPDLADENGYLPSEMVWAALDCPTCAPIANDFHMQDFRPVVLARLAVRILAPVRAGESHTIVSWRIEMDGRKRHAGAALHDPDGHLLAVARALWIELKPPASS